MNYIKYLFLLLVWLPPIGFATVIPLNDDKQLFTAKKDPTFNTYESADFSFDYAPNLSVQKWKNITFLQEDITGKQVFALFRPHSNHIRFKKDQYDCYKQLQTDKYICLTKLKNPLFLKNLTLFPHAKNQEIKRLAFMQHKGFLPNYKAHDFATRGQIVALAAKLRYPDKDFSVYAQRCFFDINLDTLYAGPICWAKDQGIVEGIGGFFYPDRSINVWGILKILSLTFTEDWPSYDPKKLPTQFFAKLHPEHLAAHMIASAWQLGILKNEYAESAWGNRAVRQREALAMIYDFRDWQNGKNLRNWEPLPEEPSETSPIFYQSIPFLWKPVKKSKPKYQKFPQKVLLEPLGKRLQVWAEVRPNIFISKGLIPWTTKNGKIKQSDLSFDFERWEGELTITLDSEKKLIYRPKIRADQFMMLKYGKLTPSDYLQFLESEGREPKAQVLPDDIDIPVWNIHMREDDFKHFFQHSTRNTRYPAFLEHQFASRPKVGVSILMKARGNANRGYIKPSITIEGFTDLGITKSTFLTGLKEVKLRSFINEETMIHEKLFYRTAQKLGLPAPKFIAALVSINGVPMGLYQVTEPIKKSFFRKRKLNTKHYFYAQNINAAFDTNLGYYKSDKTTLSAYKGKGDKALLLDLIKRIETDDPTLITELDAKNIFNYALLTWVSDAWDSLTHNYYIARNETTKKWYMIPWDGDMSWGNIPKDRTLENFNSFALNQKGSYNKLIYYTFTHLSKGQKQAYWNDFWKVWVKDVWLPEWAKTYKRKLEPYFVYDNHLWNGRFLERKKYTFNTPAAIDRLVQYFSIFNH